MIKRTVLFLLLLAVSCVVTNTAAHATSLRIAPIEYKARLATGEKKKGFVDISNPTDSVVTVQTSVQSFRQIADDGSLKFYNDKEVSGGIVPDLSSFELGPREALRMYFVIDGTKLPTGDVYVALLFSTIPSALNASSISQSVRVGTLFSIVNTTPGARSGEITGLSLPRFTFSENISGTYSIKNTGNPDTETGFYPEVNIGFTPLGETHKTTGKLIFVGRTRTNTFTEHVFPFGIYKFTVSFDGSSKSQWVIVASPLGICLTIAIVDAAVLIVVLRRRPGRTSKTS